MSSTPAKKADHFWREGMGDAEWQVIVESLQRAERWDEMWGFVFLAPVEWSAVMIRAMHDGGWIAKEEEADIWEELVRLCPKNGRQMLLTDGKLTKTLVGHADWIRQLIITPNGKMLISGSLDGTIRLWRLPDGRHIRTLEGHSDSVFCLSISPDGKILASGSLDNTIRLWDLHSGECLQILVGHERWVNCLSISPDGKTLVSGSYDRTARLWSLPSGKPIRKFAEREAIGVLRRAVHFHVRLLADITDSSI